MTTTAAVLYTVSTGSTDLIEQMLEAVRAHLGNIADGDSVTCYIPPDMLPTLAERVGNWRIVGGMPDNNYVHQDRLYILDVLSITDLKASPNVSIFNVDIHGAIRAGSQGKACASTDRTASAQAFFRLGGLDDGFKYYPYGYTYRSTCMGPVDDFGFRIVADCESLAKRPANHKVIACLGGSAVWGLHALPHQTFSAVLEDRLNRYCAANGHDLQFTVLNFGIPGATVILQSSIFMQFVHLLRPDIVVAHDGYNDLTFGQMSDPVLLRGRQMTYPINLEEWAQQLHQTTGVAGTQTEHPYKPINPPMSVVRTYITRKRQLYDIVTGVGCKFVWGLQPFIRSKGKEHRLETSSIKLKGDYTSILRLLAVDMERLYDMVIQYSTIPDDALEVNFHHLFRHTGEDDFLFWDSVHLTRHGERFIGENYADRIIDRVFQQGQWTI